MRSYSLNSIAVSQGLTSGCFFVFQWLKLGLVRYFRRMGNHPKAIYIFLFVCMSRSLCISACSSSSLEAGFYLYISPIPASCLYGHNRLRRRLLSPPSDRMLCATRRMPMALIEHSYLPLSSYSLGYVRLAVSR